MTKSFPGNVFATSSREAIESFLNLSEYKVKLDDFATRLTDDQLRRSVIVSPGNNSNLIDFEMNFNGDRKGYTAKFRFIETGSFFELQYINRDLLSERLAKLVTKTPVAQSNPDLEYEVAEIVERSADYSREIYFAFGVGDNIDNWAGPFVALLSESEVVFTENGMREISLVFVNEEGKFLRNEIEKDEAKSLYSTLDKYTNIYKKLTIKAEEQITVTKDKIFSDSMHKEITDLIKSYIYSCVYDVNLPEKNVNIIVLLPSIPNLIKNVTKDVEGAQGSPQGLSNQFLEQTGSYESIFNQMGLVCTKRFVTKEDEKKLAELTREAAIETSKLETQKQTLSVQNNTTQFAVDKYDRMAMTNANAILRPNTQKNITIIKRNIDDIQKEYTEVSKKQIFDISLRLERDKALPTEKTPDYFYPLYKFNNGFKQLYQTYANYNYVPTFFIENDLRVIKLWADNIDSTIDKTKQVYLFGDESMIQDFLYVSKCMSINSTDEFITNKEIIYKDDYSKYLEGKSIFRKRIYSLKKKNISTCSLEDPSAKSDDLALDEDSPLDNNTKEIIKLLECPVFRHNISNPNVLSLTVDNSISFLDVYNHGYTRKSLIPFITDGPKVGKYKLLTDEFGTAEYNPTVGTGSGRPGGVGIARSRRGNSLIDLIEEQHEKDPNVTKDINKIFNFITNLGSEDGNTRLKRSLNQKSVDVTYQDDDGKIVQTTIDLSDNKMAAMYAFEIFKKYNKNTGPAIEFLKEQELAAYERDLFEFLCQKVQNVTIKTLPWFSINGIPTDVTCILIGLQNLAGQNDKKQKAIYTGEYLIKGYRHVISPTEMYSEFLLYRNVASQMRLN